MNRAGNRDSETLPPSLMFVHRRSVRGVSLPGERRGELCPSGNLQHHSTAAGPQPAEKPPLRGPPWCVPRNLTRPLTGGFTVLSCPSTFEGSITPVSNRHLQAVTNDIKDAKRNQSVVFTVTSPPKLGRLVRRLPDNATQSVSMFTQSMVGFRPAPERRRAGPRSRLLRRRRRWTTVSSCTIRIGRSRRGGRPQTAFPSPCPRLPPPFLHTPSPSSFPTRPTGTRTAFRGPDC